MILAEKISEERKKNGWSQEELAERVSVSRQAVSKWESAQSVPDLQKILKLSEVFGVSTDYLLKDEIGSGAEPPVLDDVGVSKEEDYRILSMEEANEFLEVKKKSAPVIAGGVALCIMSPALLIFLAGIADSRLWNLKEGAAAGIGLAALFLMVSAAVFLFISCGTKMKRFEYLEKECFETAYGVNGMVKEKRSVFEPVFTRSLGIGVVLCIVSVVPLVTVGAIEAPDYIVVSMVSLLMILVAAGVYQIVAVAIVKGAYDTLLQEGDFSRKEKRTKKDMEAFSTIYWCTATAIYLGWSFISFRWDYTWILWPVAGVLFAAASTIVKALQERK